jgi:hypothetical protein
MAIHPGRDRRRRARWHARCNADYRYYEERIYQDVNVYVLGGFRSSSGSVTGTAMSSCAALLADWKRDPAGLNRRFDADGDGRLSLQEWEHAREQAQRDLDQRALERPALEQVHSWRGRATTSCS